MKKIFSYLTLTLLATVIIASCLIFIDYLVTRQDRLDHDYDYNNMISLKDAFLRYEDKNGSLPEKIEDLVPEYVAEPMIFSSQCWKDKINPVLEEKFKYVYDKEKRLISEQAPHQVKGLWSRKAPLRSLVVPVLQKPDDPEKKEPGVEPVGVEVEIKPEPIGVEVEIKPEPVEKKKLVLEQPEKDVKPVYLHMRLAAQIIEGRGFLFTELWLAGEKRSDCKWRSIYNQSGGNCEQYCTAERIW